MHAAFGELSERWAEVLSGDCPAAAAWDMLSRAIADQEKGRGGGGPARGALHSLTDPQADAVLLHEQLQLSDAQAADLMGLRTASLQALLRTADRTMGTDPLAR
ncbi:hypothetical protein ACFYVL_08975 [Streptomyces sp. NPDC004111]|uniref:hypothetical protein n=1 Tax=Streptomyces sp. NPDC004111 TaxID=3364690 RepID=UPI00368DE63E